MCMGTPIHTPACPLPRMRAEIVENALRERAVASLTRVDELHLLPQQQDALPSAPSAATSFPGRAQPAPSASSAAAAAPQPAQWQAGRHGGPGREEGVAVADGASGPGFFRTAAAGAHGHTHGWCR